ncbi:MAG: hypothetical protein HKN42_19745, partial [Granulosicoccus sp.]|nr:hypothetical protein [Granulosicoccus sp.]
MSSLRRMLTAGIGLNWLFLALVFTGSAVSAAPPQPDSLRYAVYSDTAAEVFWDRTSTDVARFEVALNGTVLGSFDAQSYFSNTLVKGTSYTFDVTAIGTDGTRSLPASVSFIGGDRSAAPGVPDAQAPPAPSNLRGVVYSRTAAELFWDPAPVSGLKYEIARNGENVATIQGISYFDSTLAAGVSYQFDVTAIDSSGRRSSTNSVTLTTTGGVTAPVATLPAPAGLRASVYSSTAAELFWNLSTTPGVSYDISRNGTLLGNFNGTSYFDKTLSPGTSYEYELVAVDAQNNRSLPATVMFNTSGGTVIVPDTDPSPPTVAALTEPAGLFQSDGYGTIDVIRADVKTVTTPGICTIDDLSGCTLADVIADIDGDDEFKVDIPVHFMADDFPDDGLVINAELRQRGGFTRLAPQKSFRIKLDSKKDLWRNERRLQLNKMPYDKSRIRNKLSFDLMQDIPNLPSLRTQFVNLWIDDGQGPEDYGLFTHTEYVGGEYLDKREWNEDDRIYKIEEFVFALSDLEYLALDEEGEPLDETRFETRLSIENGDDHRKLLEMINAVNDNARPFESILEQYFDEENVLTWVTVNFLLHQTDAITHNFYLYNPVGSDKFYFLPWDYDGTFNVEPEPANSMETDELMRRLYYGYGKGRASNFINRFYRMPGLHQKVLAKAQALRNNQLM